MYKTMKRQYVKPENTVVEIQVESIIAESIPEGGLSNGTTDAREVLISDETTIIARGAWQSW